MLLEIGAYVSAISVLTFYFWLFFGHGKHHREYLRYILCKYHYGSDPRPVRFFTGTVVMPVVIGVIGWCIGVLFVPAVIIAAITMPPYFLLMYFADRYKEC